MIKHFDRRTLDRRFSYDFIPEPYGSIIRYRIQPANVRCYLATVGYITQEELTHVYARAADRLPFTAHPGYDLA